MGTGRLYAAVAAGGFRRYATYRVATAAGVFTNTVFGFILAYTYLALWHEKPHLGGYDQAQALTYVWVGQAMFAVMVLGSAGFEEELIERIRTGDIAVDLYRPVDLQLWWLAADMGRALFQLLGRGVVPMVCGAFFFDLGAALRPTALARLSRRGRSRGPRQLRDPVHRRPVGVLAPRRRRSDADHLAHRSLLLRDAPAAERLPRRARRPRPPPALVRAAPAPADVLLGEADPWGTYAFQLAWAAVLLAVGRLIQSAATRKVVVQGG